jgi:hypothetical protein
MPWLEAISSPLAMKPHPPVLRNLTQEFGGFFAVPDEHGIDADSVAVLAFEVHDGFLDRIIVHDFFVGIGKDDNGNIALSGFEILASRVQCHVQGLSPIAEAHGVEAAIKCGC